MLSLSHARVAVETGAVAPRAGVFFLLYSRETLTSSSALRRLVVFTHPTPLSFILFFLQIALLEQDIDDIKRVLQATLMLHNS